MRSESVRHPVFARCYAWLSRRMERELAAHRERLLAGLTGEVVEIGAGNGMNFGHYPRDVSRVVAVEPEPHLRALAKESAARAPVPIEVVDGVAANLPSADEAFDAAVVSLVLCSVPDPTAALTEFRRVVRPGGQQRFLEHVRADTPVLGAVQRALDATLWPILAGGCHTHRDTERLIRATGWTVESCDPVHFPDVSWTPTSPHVLGVATR